MGYFVVVHTGAGSISPSTRVDLSALCSSVVSHVSTLLSQTSTTATDAAIAGTVLLEDSPLTNAGVGSSISREGLVRTEACIAASDTGFHCVGDLEGVRNPIRVVREMIREREEGVRSGNSYIPPRIMVGDHAVERYGAVVGDLRTRRSKRMYRKAGSFFEGDMERKRVRKEIPDGEGTRIYQCGMDSNNVQSGMESSSNVQCDQMESSNISVQDTVGVICVDQKGGISCAMSSGGSIYKYTGRLG